MTSITTNESDGQMTAVPSCDRWILVGLLVVLLASYSYFWQPRGWNSGSRLMLVYAIGDRHMLTIDGLENVTRDRAFVNGHYYSDKPPGQSFLAVPLYGLLRIWSGSHPTNTRQVIQFWWVDHALTFATSGILSALTCILLYRTVLQLGVDHLSAVLIALSYGLATPAFIYATHFHGHQVSAFFALASFLLLPSGNERGLLGMLRLIVFGVCSSFTVVTDYSLVFHSALLCMCAAIRCRSWMNVLTIAIAGAIPAGLLLWYHNEAYGGPFQLGYFHETEQEFKEIYSKSNPIGLTRPSADRLFQMLFSPRGLIWYAPIVLFAPFGWLALARRKQWTMAIAIAACFGSVALINSAHPTWWGGWATGPRYLLPALPFVMIAVGAAFVHARKWQIWVGWSLFAVGLVICLGCVSWRLGGQLPDYKEPGGDNPLVKIVLPDVLQGKFGSHNFGNVLVHETWQYDQANNWFSLFPWLEILAGGLLMLIIRSRQLQRRRWRNEVTAK